VFQVPQTGKLAQDAFPLRIRLGRDAPLLSHSTADATSGLSRLIRLSARVATATRFPFAQAERAWITRILHLPTSRS
jgi:hypothetical protein